MLKPGIFSEMAKKKEYQKSRVIKITVRFTPAEYEKIKKQVADNCLAAWIRKKVLDSHNVEGV